MFAPEEQADDEAEAVCTQNERASERKRQPRNNYKRDRDNGADSIPRNADSAEAGSLRHDKIAIVISKNSNSKLLLQ